MSSNRLSSNHPDKHATAHKKLYNLTTIANIPLVAWLIYSVFALKGVPYEEFTAYFTHPVNLVMAIAFVAVTLKHFALELQVVYEDYISCTWFRALKIGGMKIIFLLLGLTAILSLLKIGL